MQDVLFITASQLPPVYYLRQFPGQRPVWGDYQFHINAAQPGAAHDFCVVYEDLPAERNIRCRPGGRILFTAEPPEVRQYHPDYLAQFDLIVAVDRSIQHPNVEYSQQALQWMVGWRFFQNDQGQIKDYDFFQSQSFENKSKCMAIVASKKTITRGHALRYEFALKLKEHFGDRLDMFGLGIREIDDKWDALADYEYCLAIENSVIPDYWTEKLCDPLLTLTFPFYYGCPNVGDYFPEETILRIDLNDVPRSIDAMESAIQNNLRAERLDTLREARRRVLEEHNVFAVIARLAGRLQTQNVQNEYDDFQFRPHAYFKRNLWQRVRSTLGI